MILLMDGVKYKEWTPTSHSELEGMIKEHHGGIFGEGSIYFDIKPKLRGGSIGAIPDAYCLTFGPDTLWVIEVERSTPDPSKHLVRQLGDFINGLSDPQAQRELRDALLEGLDQQMREQLRKSVGELHPWLERLISSPSLLVVTERATDEIKRRVGTLRITPMVYEFRTFRRQGAESVHIYQFEPLGKREQASFTTKSAESDKTVELPDKVIVKVGRSTITYGEMRIPGNGLELFPREPGKFEVQTDSFLIEDAHMGGASMKNYVEGPGIRRWIREHKDNFKPGDRLIFSVIEAKKRYRLSLEKA